MTLYLDTTKFQETILDQNVFIILATGGRQINTQLKQVNLKNIYLVLSLTWAKPAIRRICISTMIVFIITKMYNYMLLDVKSHG